MLTCSDVSLHSAFENCTPAVRARIPPSHSLTESERTASGGEPPHTVGERIPPQPAALSQSLNLPAHRGEMANSPDVLRARERQQQWAFNRGAGTPRERRAVVTEFGVSSGRGPAPRRFGTPEAPNDEIFASVAWQPAPFSLFQTLIMVRQKLPHLSWKKCSGMV
jgi:hypothetical protein